MLSCVITAYKEPETIGRAIDGLIEQTWSEDYEILVICPDEATANIALSYAQRYPQVHYFKDKGEGKPAALNLALEHAQGRLCIFTDGDVEVLPNAIEPLLAHFSNTTCGAVTGRPISASPRSTMLGYWSHLLTDTADAVRKRRASQNAFLDCSGYLYAVRRELLAPWPQDTLADDAYMTQYIWQQGYAIDYAPEARVLVRYPTTYHDWLLQKIRSTAGAATIAEMPAQSTPSKRPPARMRSFWREALGGLQPVLTHPRSVKEFGEMLCLLAARLHLWLSIAIEVRLKHRSYKDIWRRVETTK